MKKNLMKTLETLTPKFVVDLLNSHIIGQEDAKKAVAIALRSRYRRMLLSDELREEIAPKNILLIGPTGVGKTEIARRLARLINAPFIKVEATRFTEVGYVGRDVESMVRDLVSTSFNIVKKETEKKLEPQILEKVEERILDALLPGAMERSATDTSAMDALKAMKKKLHNKEMENETIQIKLRKSTNKTGTPLFGVLSNIGMEDMENQMSGLFDQFGGAGKGEKKERTVTISEARRALFEEESENLIDMEAIKTEAVYRTENLGIVFLDEMDKIASNNGQKGPDVSREGVQRDLLPIVEGTTVNTRYGQVKTDHILFIGAGAFHFSKPSDLIPELQGRFPIRMQLSALKKEELYRILVEPKNALIVQYQKLLETEGITLIFKNEAIEFIASYAAEANEKIENIGARRLHTVLEKVLEDLSYNASELKGQEIIIDEPYVKERLKDASLKEDLTHYIL